MKDENHIGIEETGTNPNPQFTIRNPQWTGHARNGKVARLPHEIRQIVNTMLNDGHPYPAIVRRLAELGYPALTVHNIGRWRRGGYEDWLDAQDELDLEKIRAQTFSETVKEFQDGSDLENASETVLALHLFRVLQDLDYNKTGDPLGDRLNKFLRLQRAATRQTAERTRRERLNFHKETKETGFLHQLLADPKKLTSFLGQLRAKLSEPPDTAPNCGKLH